MLTTKMFLSRLKKNRSAELDNLYEKGARGELGNILHLPVGYSCNNNCIHCPYANKKKLYRNTHEYKSLLKSNRKERNLLIISGGEPTIRDDLFELIVSARKLSYEWIQLKTNGRLFCNKDFAQKIADIIISNPVYERYREINNPLGYNFGNLGIFEFNISLYGHNTDLHDSITQVPGSFEQTVNGIKNLIELKQTVLINIIISNKNYEFLPEIAGLSRSLGAEQIEFNFVNINNITNYEDITLKLSNLKEFIIAAFNQLGLNKKIDATHPRTKVFLRDIPYCITKEFGIPGASHAEIWYPYDQHEMYKLADFDGSYSYYDFQIKSKTKGKKCFSCIYDPICSGIWKRYIEIYGDDELQPVFGNTVNMDQIKYLKELNKFNLNNFCLKLAESKIDFNIVKADAVVHFSGGIDSTLAAELFAEQNPDKKIVLITYDNIPPPVNENSILTAKYLLEKNKNIIKHLIIPIPYALSKKIIFENLEEKYKKYGSYVTCTACKSLRAIYTIYLLKKHFKGSIVIDGMKKQEGNPYQDKFLERILNEYSIKIVRPLELMDKKEVIAMAQKRGLPFKLMNPSNQAGCWTNLIKSRLKKVSNIEGKIAYRKELLKHLTLLLEKEGLYGKD